MGVGDGWVEIGDRVFVRRYAFYDQNIGVVLGGGEALVIDTRSTHVQAREILDDLRELTRDPVTVVVDTHGHFDHAYGNRVFRPATIWGHDALRDRSWSGPASSARGRIAREEPDLADDLARGRHRPAGPDVRRARHDRGRRPRASSCAYLGRGHTDHDIVIDVPGRRRPVRRRPDRERRRPVLRRRLSARLAGDGRAPGRRSCAASVGARATATTAGRAFADVAGGIRSRRSSDARPGRVHAGDPRPSTSAIARPPVPGACRPRTSGAAARAGARAAPGRARLTG